MKRQTLAQKIAEVKNSRKDSSRENNAKVYAINKSQQVENETKFYGLSNWTRQNLSEVK